eukprot:7870079-Pyramimonas_sp.AAC.1
MLERNVALVVEVSDIDPVRTLSQRAAGPRAAGRTVAAAVLAVMICLIGQRTIGVQWVVGVRSVVLKITIVQ